MNHINNEVYASLEIAEYHLNFIVMFYDNLGEYNVLYNKQISGKFCNDGIILNQKETSEIIKNIIEDANNSLGLHIKKVGLILPNEGLAIIKSVSNKKYKKPKVITMSDILELKNSTKQLYIPTDQIIAFIKPYLYITDSLDKSKQLAPPIEKTTSTLTIKSLVYTINKEVFHSHIETLEQAKLKTLSITTKALSLGLSAGTKNLKKGLFIIDWNEKALEISIFIKESLVVYEQFASYGIDSFISSLEPIFKSNIDNMKSYLYNVLNNELLTNTKNFIIYKNYDENKNYFNVTMKQLSSKFKHYCNNVFEKIKETFKKHFNLEELKEKENILLTGDILKVNGFEEIIKEKTDFKFLSYSSDLIGANGFWSIPLIGNIFYQHITNKIKNKLTTSV